MTTKRVPPYWINMDNSNGPGAVNQKGYTLELAKNSVGRGWASLIEEVFEEAKKYPHIKITQVKEKWGLLRIYVDQSVELTDSLFENDKSVKEFWRFLSEMEHKSGKVCEDCGEPGFQRKGGWIRTLCDKCDKNQK